MVDDSDEDDEEAAGSHVDDCELLSLSVTLFLP